MRTRFGGRKMDFICLALRRFHESAFLYDGLQSDPRVDASVLLALWRPNFVPAWAILRVRLWSKKVSRKTHGPTVAQRFWCTIFWFKNRPPKMAQKSRPRFEPIVSVICIYLPATTRWCACSSVCVSDLHIVLESIVKQHTL